MFEALSAMASVFTDPYLIALIFATTILGVIIGVLPGLGSTTGAALLLPFTLTMEPVQAIAVLSTIYVSATFAAQCASEHENLHRDCGQWTSGPLLFHHAL